MTRAELIAALEAATEPSRELDAEIAALCHPTDDPRLAAFENGRDYPDLYTSAIDAALTLVPEGMSVDLHIGPRDMISEAQVIELIQHPIAAIAICIAALLARGDA